MSGCGCCSDAENVERLISHDANSLKDVIAVPNVGLTASKASLYRLSENPLALPDLLAKLRGCSEDENQAFVGAFRGQSVRAHCHGGRSRLGHTVEKNRFAHSVAEKDNFCVPKETPPAAAFIAGVSSTVVVEATFGPRRHCTMRPVAERLEHGILSMFRLEISKE